MAALPARNARKSGKPPGLAQSPSPIVMPHQTALRQRSREPANIVASADMNHNTATAKGRSLLLLNQ
jgi:hypothetical protein